MKLSLLPFVLLLVANLHSSGAWRSFKKGRNNYGDIGEPNLSKLRDPPKEQWFTQYLDHDDVVEGRTWKQRYFMNSDYYKDGGPIFLMIGGEGPASGKWMLEGAMIEYARDFGAMCFLLEHRYYGMSHPVSDLGVKNMKWLTSQQALGDLAYFINGMKGEHKLTNNKWIVFGGSYPGSLAAWMRYKYPHLVHGAVSSSGPLLAKIDFQEYMIVVEESLKTHSQACVDAIANATSQVDLFLKHRNGQQELEKLFHFCDPIDQGHTSQDDIANLYETVAEYIADVVQYNKDNRNGSSISIDDVCDVMVDQSKGIPLQRLAKVISMLLEKNKDKCLDYKFNKMVDELRNLTWSEQEKEAGGRQWMYQTCTEFGFYQTSTARPKLFSQSFPVEFFIKQCTKVFGPRFEHTLEPGVIRTNLIYGGLTLPEVVSNVVFVHGSIDPWHALGIINSTLPNAPSIFIKGTAHCANVYPSSDKDLPQLTEARKKIAGLIKEWLM
ncbi:putative serine protease K12H4.7 [Copidosoma floridanum]|uniref:putative serine protease K12H4.7 n=1 Tax=Copidosoma floridanum TaxID=29053 RepID=UPI0006C99228|nr:putative serine protease K12H4.7 [Copidosoma floridanum]XP_014215128.1 putative serine protease K12H4.7 [Copidosoma floridanum]XP_014215130.1 putative serine protease K12H4.7 [Copidosoma floridanum]XP_014215131.1 putative serine protease K12H4.7 [Copidosoma floridanum]XP_014215132.1 putative serine protease K12H4.7 [Copidosoma floridanum]